MSPVPAALAAEPPAPASSSDRSIARAKRILTSQIMSSSHVFSAAAARHLSPLTGRWRSLCYRDLAPAVRVRALVDFSLFEGHDLFLLSGEPFDSAIVCSISTQIASPFGAALGDFFQCFTARPN